MKKNKEQCTNTSDKNLYQIDKPSTPHIMDSQTALTEEEYKKRLFVEEQLSKVGISTSVFDTSNSEYEDPNVLEAIILVNRGEVIPEALKIKIQEKNKSLLLKDACRQKNQVVKEMTKHGK